MPGRCLWQGYQHSHGTFQFFRELDSVLVGQELRTYEAETALSFLRPAAHHGLPFLVLLLWTLVSIGSSTQTTASVIHFPMKLLKDVNQI